MAESLPRNEFRDDPAGGDEDSRLSFTTAAGIGDLTRKLTATASQLMAPEAVTSNSTYRKAMEDVHMQMRSSTLQNKVRALVSLSPTDLARSRFSSGEMQHRALSFVPDELLRNIPDKESTFSLFQGFQASFPEMTDEGKEHRSLATRGRRLLKEPVPPGAAGIAKLEKDWRAMVHELNMLSIRKSMADAEIIDIDNKIANLKGMRSILVDRRDQLEDDIVNLEHDKTDLEIRIEDMVDEEEEQQQQQQQQQHDEDEEQDVDDDEVEQSQTSSPSARTPLESDVNVKKEQEGFMSQSVYEKIPQSASKTKRSRLLRRKSTQVRREPLEPGSQIREMHTHADQILAMDFDAPFGILVTSALDDSVRVWDLDGGRCMGVLEGHTASVRALQVQDSILATGSADASIRLWDLSKIQYDPHERMRESTEEEEAFVTPSSEPPEPPVGSTDDCALYALHSHMGEITALNFGGSVLVSGSSDKTIRHWDLNTGRCVQTLDVMWAAAQASTSSSSGIYRSNPMNRADIEADFVGALQVFEGTALACGTADGLVRLWDLRSGQVHRTLVAHTAPITSLQFDAVHLVTASLDKSVRVWDLRQGTIHEAYAYENPITSMMFDARRICSAAGENVVKVYDKTEGRQWECGAGKEPTQDSKKTPAVVEVVRVRDGYMVEGRCDGVVGVWAC